MSRVVIHVHACKIKQMTIACVRRYKIYYNYAINFDCTIDINIYDLYCTIASWYLAILATVRYTPTLQTLLERAVDRKGGGVVNMVDLYCCYVTHLDCAKHEKQFEDPISKQYTKGASFRTSLSASMSSVAYRPLPYIGSVFTQYSMWSSMFAIILIYR